MVWPVPPDRTVRGASWRYLLGVCCSVVIVLAGDAARAAEKWTYASSDHFEIYTTASAGRAREALVYFERVHAFFADFLKLETAPSHPTRLIIFSNAREFEPYRLNDFATAYYAPGPDRDSIVMRSFDSESYPVVVHEYAHLVARHSGAAYPVWLNEGLAEFFSTLVPEAGEMSIGKVPRGRLLELMNGKLMDLPRLFAVHHGSPEYSSRNHAGMFYAQSWALTHMVMTAEAYRARSGSFTSALARGTDAAAAFQSIYGKSLNRVADDLAMYVRSQHFVYFTTKYRDPKSSATSAPRDASSFEAGLVTANLLADRQGKQDEARAAYDRLARERPDDLELIEARGIFEMRYGDRGTARTLLARAASLGSGNPAVYRWAAALSEAAAERAAFLERAVTLSPNDLELRLLLASALLATRDVPAATRLLDGITQAPPEQAFMYYQLMANAGLLKNDFGNARVAAERAESHARSDRESEYAGRLKASIDSYVAARSAADRAVRQTAVAATPAAVAAAAAPGRHQETDAPTGTTEVSRLTGQVLTVVSGRIRTFDCRGSAPILEVQTDAGTVRLSVDDPLKIQVVGLGGPTTDLTCGEHNASARIGYTPAVNASSNTVGLLRLLDFQ